MTTITPTQSAILAALRGFLLEVLPVGTEVIAAAINRVPEPAGSFVLMSPIRFQRISTNLDAMADVKFTASLAGNLMTVTDLAFGVILIGAQLLGTGILSDTIVRSQIGGTPGGVGTYRVTQSQTIAPAQTMASGAQTLEQGSEAAVQLDFHTADLTASDMAQTVSTMLRDQIAFDIFANQNPDLSITPLYASDPTYRPFINENQQYEWRWVVEAALQATQVVSVPQQYADVLEVDVVSIDAAYPVD